MQTKTKITSLNENAPIFAACLLLWALIPTVCSWIPHETFVFHKINYA